MPEDLGAHKAVEAVVGEQELNDTQKALVDEVYSRLRYFIESDQELHDRAKDARKILLLNDPYQDEAEPDGSFPDPPTIQLQSLVSTFNNCVADQMDNMPEAILMPERAELQERADDLTDVVRYVLEDNNYETLHYRRVSDFIGTGTSVVQVVWDDDMDFGKGNIAVIRWPVEAFLWDPLAESLQDSRALMKVSWHPLSWFPAHFPEDGKYVASEEGEHNDVGVVVAQDTGDINDEEQRAMLIEYWYRKYDAKKRRYIINVAYLAGGALLAHAENVFAHGLYPFVVDAYAPVEGYPVGDGMVQQLAPMMRYINRYARYIDTNLRMSSKGRMLINRNAGIDKSVMADWSQDIIEADRVDSESYAWLQHTPFNGMVTNQMLQLQTDLKMDSGQNQFQRGETAGGVTAASAISALQEAGSKITRLRTAVLNHGFKQIVEHIMWLVYEFYGEGRMRMITGKNGRLREVDMSAMHLFGASAKAGTPPPYTVQVQIQRRNPLRVQAQNELFMQAYSMAAQAQQVFPLTLLFEMLTVDGKDRLMPILQQVDQATQMMQQLAEQNEALTQENEALQQGIANLKEVSGKLAAMQGGGMYASGATAPQEAAPIGL